MCYFTGGQRGCRDGCRNRLGDGDGEAAQIKHNLPQQFSGRDLRWAMSKFTWTGRKDISVIRVVMDKGRLFFNLSFIGKTSMCHSMLYHCT